MKTKNVFYLYRHVSNVLDYDSGVSFFVRKQKEQFNVKLYCILKVIGHS